MISYRPSLVLQVPNHRIGQALTSAGVVVSNNSLNRAAPVLRMERYASG